MKFTVSASALHKELQTIAGAISNNTVLPILEDFLFVLDAGTLTIYASDLETSMSAVVEGTSETEDGRVAIPAKILLETLKTLPEQPLSFEIDENSFAVSISASNGNYKLAGENGDDFPNIPNPEDATETEMPGSVLLNAINKTLFAVSNDELRPAMTGVYVELNSGGTTFVATDAHKLVKYSNASITSTESANFIIPRKAMGLLKNAVGSGDTSVHISYNTSNAFFSMGNIKLTCRLIDAKFPDYNAVIPKDNQNRLTLSRQDFQNVLRRISIFASKSTYQVVLAISDEGLTLTAQDIDYSNEAKESMNCEYEGENMDIAFNAKFLVEILGVLNTDEVVLQLASPSRAGLILPSENNENEELIMLLMPIMINQ